MQISAKGRFVFYAQWALALLLPVWFFIGRVAVGAELGWLSVLGMFVYGIFAIILLLVPPAVTLADAEVRAQKAERAWYSNATLALWLAIFLAGLVVPDAADGGPLPSALTKWTGGAISHAASAGIFYVLAAIVAVIYLVSLGLAVAGALRGRRARAGA